MKKRAIIFCTLVLLFVFEIRNQCFAQKGRPINKPAIDTGILGKWPNIVDGSPTISDDGKYSMYIINDPVTSNKRLVIVSNRSLVKIEIPSVNGNARFTNDSKHVLFLNNRDSLGVVDVNTFQTHYTPNVISFKVANTGNWHAYLEKGPAKRLIIANSLTGKQRTVEQSKDYDFTLDGAKLVVKTQTPQDTGGNKEALYWIDLLKEKDTKVWCAYRIGVFNTANSSSQLAFSAIQQAKDHPVLYLFDESQEVARIIVSDKSVDSLRNLDEVSDLYFSRQSDKILFSITKKYFIGSAKPTKDPGLIIWNYKDLRQKDNNINRSGYRNVYYAVDLKMSTVVQSDATSLDLWHGRGIEFENNLMFTGLLPPNKPSIVLVSAKNAFPKRVISSSFYDDVLSPNEQFVLWYDLDSLSFYSYNISSAEKHKVSIPYPPCDTDVVQNECFHQLPPYGVAGWSADGHSAFVYDEFDIWKIDLAGITAPVSLTGGIGRKYRIIFSLLEDPTADAELGNKFIGNNKDLILEGFAADTKDNGFWVLPHGSQNPQKIIMSRHFYAGRDDDSELPTTNAPVKAKNANIYIVQRQAADEYPNLYITKDFKAFDAISDLHPEKNVNWLSTELVTWKLPDGRASQGVLYKPENFDPQKKYPVLVHYFERKSGLLNGYLIPDWGGSVIDIPYYVSNGYLVFTPDNHWRRDHQGQSVADMLVSAAHCLAARPYIDSTRMGIMGHSWAGWQTNFTVTHSHIFAAACAAAGMSDLVSAYDESIRDFPASYIESRVAGIGKTPWNKTDFYIENSPILSADQATTPLLIMQGSLDIATPPAQAVEMYEGLHRAGKKVWLLQYTTSGHGVNNQFKKDFTIRMKQFFDYYLMGSPPPIWMTRGVTNFSTGTTGLQIDTSGAKP